jgi:regulator of chromosome condensation
VEEVVKKHAIDIFCGGQTSFYKDKDSKIYAFGLNNHGQLGIGNKETSSFPTQIKKFEGINVIDINGGEHHSIALTDDGRVYCWGRNDEG